MQISKLITLVAGLALVGFLADGVNAADFYWDGTPSAANGASDGGPGTWDLTTGKWDNGSESMVKRFMELKEDRFYRMRTW